MKNFNRARVVRLGPFEVFLGHVHSPAYVPGLLESQEYFGLFQSPQWSSHSPMFSFNSFLPALIWHNFVTISGSYDVKQLSLIFFNTRAQGKGCLHWEIFESGKINMTPVNGSLSKLTHRSNSDSSLGMGPIGELQTWYSPSGDF